MHKELPLYVFVRNTIILGLVFFVISAFIIERGRYERGENSLFNRIMIKQNKIRDYNNFDITNSQTTDPIIVNANSLANTDSIVSNTNQIFTSSLVNTMNKQLTGFSKIDL